MECTNHAGKSITSSPLLSDNGQKPRKSLNHGWTDLLGISYLKKQTISAKFNPPTAHPELHIRLQLESLRKPYRHTHIHKYTHRKEKPYQFRNEKITPATTRAYCCWIIVVQQQQQQQDPAFINSGSHFCHHRGRSYCPKAHAFLLRTTAAK